MPIKPKDSRLIGFNRVKPRLQRLPKKAAIPEGIKLAEDTTTGVRIAYNPPASSPNPLVTPTAFLPAHLRQHTYSGNTPQTRLPPRSTSARKQACLDAAQIEEVKSLRSAGSSIKEIARKFSISPLFVSLVAPLSKAERRTITEEQELRNTSRSERAQVYSQIRQNKRATWGMA